MHSRHVGVLVVGVGARYTRRLSEFTSGTKTYVAEATFGIGTDSLDATGRVGMPWGTCVRA